MSYVINGITYTDDIPHSRVEKSLNEIIENMKNSTDGPITISGSSIIEDGDDNE